MSVFAIADLHLSLGTDKPMDIFRGWDDYVSRLEKSWRALVTPEDTVVVAGDISWGMTLEDARTDFAFLDALPGKKCIIKGNHDFWWTTRRKMETFFADNGYTTLRILHNDAAAAGGYALCGTRGWFYDAEADADKKVLLREAGRLRASITEAKKTGLEPVVFLHYPPRYADAVCDEIWSILLEEEIRLCYYGHIHGGGIRRATEGWVDGVRLKLISCDAVAFTPVLVR